MFVFVPELGVAKVTYKYQKENATKLESSSVSVR